jgi:ATP-binding cassette, subfamily C (CFTR/MRP), member 1
MQAVIHDSFKSSTVIAIMHKLEHTMDYDRIGVLQDGRLVEYDTPSALISTPGSLFAQLRQGLVTRHEDGFI